MKKHYRKFMMIGMIAIMVVTGGLFLGRPVEKTEAAVVFTNIATVDNICLGGGVALIFDVPIGQDYQVNSVQLRLQSTAAATPNPRIYADNAGMQGPEVIDLGSIAVPAGLGTYTFTPTGADVLTNGGRYWLVLPAGAAFWCANSPLIAPTGVFTFADNGFVAAGVLSPQANGVKLSIDADPIVPPPTGGGGSVVVPACSNSDGRLNSICEEPYQTAAVYCRADGSIDVYGITDGVGWLAVRTTQSEIDAVGIPAQNEMIERSDDGTIRLYRLSTGEFQVNAPRWDNIQGNLPDGYVFRFSECPQS
jgi:hypothetical protein